MSTHNIVSLLIFIAFYYVSLIYVFPFKPSKSYEANERIFNLKEQFGGWCAFILFVWIMIGIYWETPTGMNWFQMILCVMVGIFATFLLVIFPIGHVETAWKTYHLQNFPTKVTAHLTACTPTHCTTQEKHYKSIPLENNSCTVTMSYTYDGKQYSKIYMSEPIKIYYTYEPTDHTELTISSKNPTFVMGTSIAQIMPFLMERTIEKARFEKDNYGTYIEPEGGSGCGCGCG